MTNPARLISGSHSFFERGQDYDSFNQSIKTVKQTRAHMLTGWGLGSAATGGAFKSNHAIGRGLNTAPVAQRTNHRAAVAANPSSASSGWAHHATRSASHTASALRILPYVARGLAATNPFSLVGMTALSFLAQHVITRYVTIKPPRADLEIYPPHAGDLSTHVPGRSIEIPRPWTPEATGVPVRRLPQITVHEGAPPVQAPRLEGYVPHVRAPREGLLESRQYDDQWRKQKDQALEERIVAILEREQSVDKTIGTLLAIEDRYRQLLRAHDDRVDRTDYSPGSDGYGQFLDDAIFKLHVVTATLIASRQYGLKALSAQYGKSIYDEQWLARPENSEARNAVENLRTQGRSEKILDIVREHLRQGDLDREGGVIDIMNDMLKKLFTDADEEFY